jgi:hypothetical protein
MKISFGAVAAFVLASAFLQTAGYAQAPPPGQPYIQVPMPQIPGFGPPPRGSRTTIGSGGSIARGLGTESTTFAIGWPMRHLTVRIERG